MVGENLELISLNVWHVIFSIVMLLLVTLIVKKYLFDPVQKVLAQRNAELDALRADAQSSQQAADTAKAEYEAKLAKATKQAADIRQNAVIQADRKSEKILSEATDRAAEKIRAAEADIAKEKEETLTAVRGDIADMSVQIAGQVVGRDVKKEDHGKVISSFLEKKEG